MRKNWSQLKTFDLAIRRYENLFIKEN